MEVVAGGVVVEVYIGINEEVCSAKPTPQHSTPSISKKIHLQQTIHAGLRLSLGDRPTGISLVSCFLSLEAEGCLDLLLSLASSVLLLEKTSHMPLNCPPSQVLHHLPPSKSVENYATPCTPLHAFVQVQLALSN